MDANLLRRILLLHKPRASFAHHRVILDDTKREKRTQEDDLPVLICKFQEDSTLTYVNKEYANYFQTTPEKILRHPFLDLLPKEVRKDAKESYGALTPENPFHKHSHEVLLPEGER